MITISIFGTLAALLFLNGIAILVSPRHHERYQSFFKIKTKAPPNLDAKKYYFINRMQSGAASIFAGCVPLLWIYQYLGSLK